MQQLDGFFSHYTTELMDAIKSQPIVFFLRFTFKWHLFGQMKNSFFLLFYGWQIFCKASDALRHHCNSEYFSSSFDLFVQLRWVSLVCIHPSGKFLWNWNFQMKLFYLVGRAFHSEVFADSFQIPRPEQN